MKRETPLPLLTLFAALTVLPGISTGIDYRLTVEQPVALVAPSDVERVNGTCCNPTSPTDCTVCPDDPSVDTSLFVCFRTGGAKEFLTDINHCPLGRLEFTPNSRPGPWWHFTPRPEADSLPSEYPGSIQTLVRIVIRATNASEEDMLLDNVLVLRTEVPADGNFRRISSLSTMEVAIVSVNVRVECTNGVDTADCSEEATNLTSATTESVGSTTELTTTSRGEVVSTGSQTNTPGTPSEEPQGQAGSVSPVSIVIGLCIGGGVVGIAVALVCSGILYYSIRKHKSAALKALSTNVDNSVLEDNPLYSNTEMTESQIYQEVK